MRLYQDTPYDGQFPGHAPAIVLQLRSWGATLESEDVPIDDLLDDKLRLVSVYASQFKADAVRKGIELSGATGQSPGLHEHLWRLAVVPREVNPEALTVDRADVARSTAGLRRMLPSIRRRGSLRLLLLVPSGRWAEDIAEVLDIFPALKVEVFASEAALAEAEAIVATVMIKGGTPNQTMNSPLIKPPIVPATMAATMVRAVHPPEAAP